MLEDYGQKRDFGKTPEPGPADSQSGDGPLRFVVQKHDATRVHYDLRLECDGTLKSWAVPKGPSLNPNDKHLAVMVEDHPLSYADFEGVIPKGQYGGGEVIIWDEGVYWPDDAPIPIGDREAAQKHLREGIEKGKLSFTVYGQKMKGSWTLVKIAKSQKDWLLIKHRDSTSTETEDLLEDERSVRTGRTTQDLRNGLDAPVVEEEIPEEVSDDPFEHNDPMPESLKPMLPTEIEQPFDSKDWIFEHKLDGVRVLVYKKGSQVWLRSRNLHDITYKFPGLVSEIQALSYDSLILDGEIAYKDESGKVSFQGLMERYQLQNEADIRIAEKQKPVVYYAFDLLYLSGQDLRKSPLRMRKSQLEQLDLGQGSLLLLETFEAKGKELFEKMKAEELEGIIGKKLSSVYRDGSRTQDWVKIKTYRTEEFLVGGFTTGEGMRAHTFGALLLGVQKADGLQFVGACGGGFKDEQLVEIRKILDQITANNSPFNDEIHLKRLTWVEPKICVEVRFASWTKDGNLRFPIFQRLRPDKAAVEVNEPQRAEPESRDESMASASMKKEIESILEQLKSSKEEIQLKVDQHSIRMSNLSKEYWPKSEQGSAVTKREMAQYYARVAPYLLPHLKDRPLALARYPEGVGGESFFQKHLDSSRPEYMDHVDIYSSHNERSPEYIMCNNLASLMWLCQMGTLEIHPWYSRVTPEKGLGTDFASSKEKLKESVLNYPDFMVFDLDPYMYSGQEKKGDEPELNKKAFKKTCEIAVAAKEMLDSLNLTSYLKTSGKTGLHLYIPIERNLDYEAVRALAQTFGNHLLRQNPKEITMEWSVDKRTGKIFFDHNQNSRGKTLASIYSTRPAPGAPVSFPVKWDELDSIYPTDYTVQNVPDLLDERGDLWGDILKNRKDLHSLLGKNRSS